MAKRKQILLRIPSRLYLVYCNQCEQIVGVGVATETDGSPLDRYNVLADHYFKTHYKDEDDFVGDGEYLPIKVGRRHRLARKT